MDNDDDDDDDESRDDCYASGVGRCLALGGGDGGNSMLTVNDVYILGSLSPPPSRLLYVR